MTRVVNIYREEFDVYIGRGHNVYFGNPFPLNGDRFECIVKYTQYFYDRLKNDPEFARRIQELKDKRLGCFCKPKLCHGDIIAAHLDSKC